MFSLIMIKCYETVRFNYRNNVIYRTLYYDAFAFVIVIHILIYDIAMLNSPVPIKDERFLLRSPWETTAFVWIRLANLKLLKNVKLLFLLLVLQLTVRLRENHPVLIVAGSIRTIKPFCPYLKQTVCLYA